jgi:microcin C transport system substrate-binding protein
MFRRVWICFVASISALSLPAWAGHAYSLWGDIKYPAGFAHFDYVNPAAPMGGELVAVSASVGAPIQTTIA